MKCSQILRDLSKENEDLKKIISKIHSRFTVSNKGVLEGLCKISYILYIIRDFENSLLITERLSLIPFNNDYDYWIWIEFAISLRAEISNQIGYNEKGRDSLDIIKAALNSGEGIEKKIKINVHNRFMAGEGVVLDESITDGTRQDIYNEFNHRLIYLMKLIKLNVLGASAEYSREKTLSNIKSNVQRMLVLVQENALDGAQPFR